MARILGGQEERDQEDEMNEQITKKQWILYSQGTTQYYCGYVKKSYDHTKAKPQS